MWLTIIFLRQYVINFLIFLADIMFVEYFVLLESCSSCEYIINRIQWTSVEKLMILKKIALCIIGGDCSCSVDVPY